MAVEVDESSDVEEAPIMVYTPADYAGWGTSNRRRPLYELL